MADQLREEMAREAVTAQLDQLRSGAKIEKFAWTAASPTGPAAKPAAPAATPPPGDAASRCPGSAAVAK